MARTAITPLAAVRNTAVAETTANVDQANGMSVAVTPEKLALRVTNTDAGAHNLTIKAGTNLTPAFQKGQGDYVISVPATTGVVWAGPFDSARFQQADGAVYLDVAASFAGKVTAFKLP
jgi:hypothetical protein